jgi:hypothetical protein
MYKLQKDNLTEKITSIGILENPFTVIPFDPANTDYANFKKEVLAGAELQDADGNVMTDASAYIGTLP